MNLTGRNQKCPCGSGKKFKHCCLKVDVEFDQSEAGTIRRSVPMSGEMADLMGSHLEQLADDKGGALEPDDELFPNQQLEHIEHGIVEAMKSAGIDPALVHAFEQTGLLVSEENRDLISPEQYAQWEAAVSEYRNQNGLGEHAGSQAPQELQTPMFDPALCWSCEERLPEDADQCPHCQAKVEDAPSPEDAAMMMEFLQEMNPALMDEMRQLAMDSESGEDFVNALLAGSCPACESEKTRDCEQDSAIQDPSLGRCLDCGQLFCCTCEELFKTDEAASTHTCPLWENLDSPDAEF